MAKERKKIKKIPLILLLLIVICIIIVFFVSIKKESEIIPKNNVTIKIGEQLPTIDKYLDGKKLKKIENKNIEWKDIKLEKNKVYNAGKYLGYITYQNKKIKVNLEVIDDEKPSIEGVEDIQMNINEEIDLKKNIEVSDNSHDEISLTISGEYDYAKKGEYELSYIATDKSGNQTTRKFKLTVQEKIKDSVLNSNTSNSTNSVPNQTNDETILVGTTSKGYQIKKENGIYYINNILIANKTYPLTSNYAPGKLLDTFMNAFYSMQVDAASQGISLTIISGYRSYQTQYTLYNNYVNRDGKVLADTYSARAGHSEHQSGLAADVNSLEQAFINTAEGKWLSDNCYKYGFIIRYPQGKENMTGYMYEPWHIRYVGIDVATILYNNGNWISLEEYLGITSQYDY